MSCPFATLSLPRSSTATQALQAYHDLILSIHPTDEYILINTQVHDLTAAKDACLHHIEQRESSRTNSKSPQ